MNSAHMQARAVKPARLPRYPRCEVCPLCKRGDGYDQTVISYVDIGQDADAPREFSCGYCGYVGPKEMTMAYPKEENE